MTGDANNLRELVAYLRDEADFNRSWVDGRRGADRNFPDAYKRRRIELAEERERWAEGVIALLDAAQERDRIRKLLAYACECLETEGLEDTAERLRREGGAFER